MGGIACFRVASKPRICRLPRLVRLGLNVNSLLRTAGMELPRGLKSWKQALIGREGISMGKAGSNLVEKSCSESKCVMYIKRARTPQKTGLSDLLVQVGIASIQFSLNWDTVFKVATVPKPPIIVSLQGAIAVDRSRRIADDFEDPSISQL